MDASGIEKVGNAYLVMVEPDVWAGYDALTLDVVFGRKSYFENMRSGCTNQGTGESLDLDVPRIPRDLSDRELLGRYQTQFEKSAGLITLWLILCDDCNFRCSYCSFFSHLAPGYRFGYMSKETVGKSLSLLQECSRDHSSPLFVVFYGGEPLLNAEAISYSLQMMKRMDWGNSRKPESVIITNGTLLHPEILGELGQYGSDIIISIDGIPDVHNMYRKDVSGQPTYARVADACDRVNSTPGARLAFSITLGKHNAASIGETLRFLSERFNPNSIGLNPLHINPDGSVKPWDITYEESADAMIEAFLVGRDIGLYIEQVTRKIRPFVKKTPRSVDCPACGGMIQSYPNGMFGPCGHFVGSGKYSLPLGNFAENELELLLRQWKGRTSHTLLEENRCSNCMARGICGGGCPLSGYKRTGSIYSADERVCVLARKLIVWLIEDLWKQVKESRGSSLFGERNFIIPTSKEREMILGNIDLDRPRALSSYSAFGELDFGRTSSPSK